MPDKHLNIPQVTPWNHADKVYYFSHIPKTGGTSFTAILDRYFDVDDIFEPQLWWEVGDIEKVREKKYRCFRGHFGMGAQALSHEKLQTLTILRNPLKMAYSTYQYVKREPKTSVHKYVNDNQLTFEEFLQDPKTRNLSKNRMFKSLSFGLGLLQGNQNLTVTEENYRKCRQQWNLGLKAMPQEQRFNLVRDYLSSCFWVGILEDFDLSLMLLCHQMSWPVIGATEKLNKHTEEPKISDKAKVLVKEMNDYDYRLYDYAKNMFHEKLKATFNDFEVKGENFESLRAVVDSNYQQSHQAPKLPEQIDFKFGMTLLGQNWHSREWSENEAAYFRWTGPECLSVVDFWLKPQQYQVRIKYINVINNDLINSLVIQANGITVEWNIEACGRSGVILFLCDESHFQQNGLLRLKLKTEGLIPHDSVFMTNDNRKVGFAVYSIKINKQQEPVNS